MAYIQFSLSHFPVKVVLGGKLVMRVRKEWQAIADGRKVLGWRVERDLPPSGRVRGLLALYMYNFSVAAFEVTTRDFVVHVQQGTNSHGTPVDVKSSLTKNGLLVSGNRASFISAYSQ